ncbi:MAG: hypothetical protein ABIT83_09105 [Massilia sp.]
MIKHLRVGLAPWALALGLGLGWLPAMHAAGACRQLPSGAMPLKFAGPELVPVYDAKFNLYTPAVYALDLSASAPRLSYAGVRRLKGSLTKSFFAGRDELPLKAVFGRSSEFNLDPRSDETTPWDILSGNEVLRKADLELSLHDGYIKYLITTDCPAEGLAYWDPQTPQVPFSRVDKDGVPHFSVTIDGVALDAVLSTMQARSTITPKAAARIPTAAGSAPAHGQMRFGLLAIGTMQSRQGYLDIAEHAPAAELVLGDEFLRAYRILLSRHQDKLYLSYQSGPSFPQAGAITYWMEHQAESGDGAAQFAMWQRLTAGARSIGKTTATGWLERAAVSKDVAASVERARQARSQGHWQESQTQLRAAIKARPNEPLLWLDLYLSTRPGGDAAAAVDALRAARKDHEDAMWPHPVGAYFLGDIGLDDMLRAAARSPESAHERSCAARRYAAEFLALSGSADESARQDAMYRSECAPRTAQASAPAAG